MAEASDSGYEEIGGLKPWDQAIVVYTKATDCTGIQGYLTLPSECDVGNDESYFNFYLGIGLEAEAGICFTKKAHAMKVGKMGYWKLFINPPGTDLYLGQYEEVKGRTFHLKLVIDSGGRTKVWLDFDRALDGHAASGGNQGPAKTSMALADYYSKVWYETASFSGPMLRFGYDGSDWREWTVKNEDDYVVKRHLDVRLRDTRIFPLATKCYATARARALETLREAVYDRLRTDYLGPASRRRVRHEDLTGHTHRLPGPLGVGDIES